MRSPDDGLLSTPGNYVALKPPLPCVDPARGAGFVHGLSSDRLLIEWTEKRATEYSQAPADITVSLSPSQTFHFRNEVMRVPAEKAKLGDLMNLVRKNQHITLCETVDVEASDRYTGFSDLGLRPNALPDLSWNELDPSRVFLGYKAKLPLLVTGMTGGLQRGAEINQRLARAAEHFGIPMGVGSQRVALENPEHAAIFKLKQFAPRLFVIGNIGMAQLTHADALDQCRRAVDMIDADALAIHLNVLQEVIQVEGDRDFRGLLDHVAEVASRLGVPVMMKEVGFGIDPESAKMLAEAGVQALDCGGKGGTSWGYIEGLRAESQVTRDVAATFRDFGIPTAIAVHAIRRVLPEIDLVATGGIRDGLTVAKAMALGATMCGIGLPLLRAALDNDQKPYDVLETFAQGLRTAMICTGARTVDDLPRRLAIKPEFLAQAAGVVDGY